MVGVLWVVVLFVGWCFVLIFVLGLYSFAFDLVGVS